MIIDGVEYQKVASDGRWAIVVCERGFVLVGTIHKSDDYWVICNCSTIRRWGTTKGLGEIARGGPTTETILDEQPETTVHELRVVQIISCNESNWQ